MANKIKIQKPKFLEELEYVKDINSDFIYSDKLQNIIFEDISLNDKSDKGITIDSCVFTNVIFTNCSFEMIDLIDTRFENCDLSNASFIGGSIHRVEFINCKLLGARFDDCNFKDILFNNTNVKYSNFSFAKLKSVNFIECNLIESTLQDVKFEKVTFDNSDLTNCYLNKTFLGKLDLTTCEISGIDVEIPNLYGIKVTAIQALDLSRLMGLEIK